MSSAREKRIVVSMILVCSLLAGSAVFAGSISGRVTRESNGDSIDGLWIYAWDFYSGDWGGAGITSATGEYEIVNLSTTHYRLRVNTSNTNYVQEYYNDESNSNDADRVAVIQGQPTSGIDFQLAVGGSISGTVTDEDEIPMEGVHLDLYQGEDEFIADNDAGDWVNSADTDANGEYQFTGLAERRYRIRANSQEVAGTPYFEANLYNVQVFAGAVNTPDMDLVLRQAGVIYGYVMTAGGDPIPNAELIAEASWTQYGEEWNWTRTDSDGKYEFWVAPSPGKFYPIWVRDAYLGDVSYESKWDGILHQATLNGTPGPDYYLDPAGAVTGRVINESDVGIEGVRVENDRWNKYMTEGPRTETDSDGTFLLDGLPTGTNYVYLSNDWREIEQDGVKYMVGGVYAGPINIIAGQTIDLGDFVIYQAGMVTGVVTDEAGFPVVAAEVELEGKDIDGNCASRDDVITDAFGQFTIDYVAPGTYGLYIEKGGFIATQETGITVDRGGHINVDVVLRSDAEGAAVSGSITNYAQIAGKDPDGVPLPFYDDGDYDEYGIPDFGIVALSMSRDYTESDYLDIDSLLIGDVKGDDIDDGYGDYFKLDPNETPGNYAMHLPPDDTALVMYIYQEFLPGWGGCAILHDWKRFNLSKADVRSGVNFTAVTTNTGTLRGDIVAPGYNYYPEDWCMIYAYALDENNHVKSPFLGDAVADPGWTTTYEFRNLPAGKYMLKAYARNLAGVIVGSVAVDSGGTTNQDIVFTSGGTLTGSITDGAGDVSGAVVGIRENGMQTTTDDSGNYTIVGINEGDSYTVTVSASGYADAEEAPVSIVAGSTTTQDFTLSPAVGTISGTVKDSQGDDINGAEVVAYNETDKTHLMATTVGGAFSIPDLTYGEYILAAQTALHGVVVYPADGSRLTLSASQDNLDGIGIVLGAIEPPEFTVSSTVETAQGVTTLSVEFQSDINLAAEPVVTVVPDGGNGALGPLTSNAVLNRFEIDYTVDNSDDIVRIRIEEAGGNPAGKTFTFEVGGDLVQTSSTNVTNAMGGETRIMGTQDDTRVYVPPFAVAGADETEALTLTVERYGDPGDAVEGTTDTSVSAVYDFHFDEDGVSIRENHTFTITMSFQLPEGMSTDEFEDTLHIRYFDALAHAWTTDYISNVRINWANSTIMFEVSHLSKFAAFVETEVKDGIITVISPNGGEQLERGGFHVFTWAPSDPSGKVKIELYKGDTYIYTIASSTPDDGGKGKTLRKTLAPGDDYRVKITSLSNSSSDFSDGYFEIPPPGGGGSTDIEVTSPNGGEELKRGLRYVFRWQPTDIPGAKVKIELYQDDTFVYKIATSTPDDGKKGKVLPSTLALADNYKMKVTLVGNDLSYDFSDNYFSIVGDDSPVVIWPNGGEQLEAGQRYVFTWTPYDPGGRVRIELYRGQNQEPVDTIASSTPDDGKKGKTLSISLPQADDYWMKVTSLTDGVYDDSDNYFEIISGGTGSAIEVISPNGGEVYNLGDTLIARWIPGGDLSSNVKIELYKGNTAVYRIASGTANDGGKGRILPDTLTAGSDYRIKITSLADESVYDFSDGYFEISSGGGGTITVISPNGGELLEAGKSYVFKWIPADPSGKVKIELYKGGSYVYTVASSTDDDGGKSKTLRKTLGSGSNYKIKITSLSNSSSDFSDGNFSIEVSVLGTWDGTWRSGIWGDTGEAMDWTFESNGNVSGSWEEDDGDIKFASGLYQFDPATGALSFTASGWNNERGRSVYSTIDITNGVVTGNKANGYYEAWDYINSVLEDSGTWELSRR